MATTQPSRQPSRKIQRLKKKILLLRIEEIILLSIIAALLFTRCHSGDFRLAGVRSYDDAEISDEYQWLQANRELFPDGKVDAAAGNPGLIHFLYEYGNGTGAAQETAQLTSEEKQADIPLLLQWDDRWGFDGYGDSNIGICGCAPTCLAMVSEGLTRDASITPQTVADYAMNNDLYLYGTGTKWDVFSEYAASQDLSCQELGQDASTIYWELEQGHPVICSMAPGTFTTGGHFIVLCKIENGEVVVNDPNNVELSSQTWDLNDIANEIKNAWAFSEA